MLKTIDDNMYFRDLVFGIIIDELHHENMYD